MKTDDEVLDYIRDRMSMDCPPDVIASIIRKMYGLSEEEANAALDEYFAIVESIK